MGSPKIEIYTELINREIEEALEGGINKLWEVYSGLEGNSEFEKEKDTVKMGVKIKFDIRAIIKGEIERFPAQNIVKIRKKQKEWIEDYDDEVDERKRIMKETLRSLYVRTFDKQKEGRLKGYEE